MKREATISMSDGIVEGGFLLTVGDEQVELKKLSLGNLKTLEKTYGDIQKALGTMDGIAHAIYLAAKRGGFKGQLADIADAIEFDQIQTVVGVIASQQTLTLSLEESVAVRDLLASVLMAENNEDAKAAIFSLADQHRALYAAVKERAAALKAPSGEGQGVNK